MSYDFELDNGQYGLIDPPSSGYPTAYGWSASVWFKAESLVSDEAMFCLRGSTDGNVCCIFRIDNSNKLSIYRRGTSGTPISYASVASISTGSWYLMTYAETSRTSRKFWLNSTEITTDSTDLLNDWAAADNLSRIGVACQSRRVADGDVTNFFDGKVAEVAIWPSTVLTQANVDSLYGGALASSVAGGPSLWWRFNTDKGSSTYAADTGTGTLNLTASPVYSADHPTLGGGGGGIPKTTRLTMLGVG